jgi:hypothetical protein
LDLTYLSNSKKHHDKLILSINSTAKDLIERIEEERGKDTSFAMRVYHKGKELQKNTEALEKYDIHPLSKILVLTSAGKPSSATRFSQISEGWGYGSTSVDAISFTVSKTIRVVGFGIYRPNSDGITITGTAKFCVGTNS